MNGFTIFFVAFMLFAIVQRVAETFARRNIVRGRTRANWSLGAMIVLHVLMGAGTVAEFFYCHRADTPLFWLTGIGLCLYIGSVLLRNAAIRALGKFWSLHVEIREQHELVTDGVYGWVRHPAYLAIWLEVISVPLVGNAFFTSLAMGAVYLLFLLWRISVEERALMEQLGQEYREYQKRVPRLFPVRLPRKGEGVH